MIIALTGPNSFLLKAELKKLTEEFIETHGDIGLETLDGEDVPYERLAEAAGSLPFLASRKMVVLRNPSAQKQFVETIEQVISSVPETTDLVVVEPKIDKRSVYFKVLKANTDFKEFIEQDTYGLNNWIVQYVKEQGGAINLSDANYLIGRAGQNQQMLANEIDKLLTFEPNISRKNIDLLTERTPQSTIFELLDAAFAGNIKVANELYKEQRALKVDPQQILALLAWQLHILAIVKTAGDRSPDQITKDSKLSPYVVRKAMAIASKVSLADVKRLVRSALSLDVKLKSESVDADEALQHFLLTIS